MTGLWFSNSQANAISTRTWTTQTSGTSSVLSASCYQSIFLAGGAGGALISSTDGTTWSGVTSGTTTSIRSIAYGNSAYVYLCNGILGGTSTDGTTWTSINPSFSLTTSTNLPCIYGTKFVAAGSQGTMATSTDAITWATKNPVIGAGITSMGPQMISSGSLFLATCGTSKSLVTSTDGIMWNNVVSPGTTSTIFGVNYANSQYMYCGAGGIIYTSTDTVTWTHQYTSGAIQFTCLIWGTVYVAGGTNGALSTSTDGITWTSRTSGAAASITAMVYGSSLYVLGNGTQIRTSVDAITWTGNATSLTGTIRTLLYGNSLYLATANLNIYSSATALTWTLQTSALTSGTAIVSSAYGAGRYLVGNNGGQIGTSTDAITWTLATGLAAGTSSFNVTALYFDSGTSLFYANLENLGVNYLHTSTDGVTFSRVIPISGTTTSIFGLCYVNSLYLAVGANGLITTSTDLVTWNIQTSGTTSSLFSVGYGNSIYLAGGSSGVMRRSTDGTTWTTVISSGRINSTINSISYSGSTYVYAADAGQIGSSPNGINWSLNKTSTTSAFNSLSANSTTVVAVGQGGLIETANVI